ncbi:hypothetical protein K3495_g12323 [Podosphaera aphanis]|nr:hypothetical protein K3495_g12323 [Podosphaera aphanis]
MASVTPHNDSTLITIKINFDGHDRRLRLPLRDFAPSLFIDKLRLLLAIPSNSQATFERFSDSAGAYIVLDPSNTSVFKQLYCAARVKKRLRMRATIIPSQVPATGKNDSNVVKNNPNEDSGLASAHESRLKNIRTILLARNGLRNAINSSPGNLTDIQNRLKNLHLDESQFSSINTATNQSTAILSDDYKRPKEEVNYYVATSVPIQASSTLNTKVEIHQRVATDKLNNNPTLSVENFFQHPKNPKPTENKAKTETIVSQETPTIFNIFCNICKASVSKEHYHCSNCDNGDYDLCLNCVADGFHCPGEDHWLIKRFIRNDKVEYNKTERIAPKANLLRKEYQSLRKDPEDLLATRTCNCCVQVFTEEHFITCTTCPDYDLCITCHTGMVHGHHPKHEFKPAIEDVSLTNQAQALLAPGRGVKHDAICDGCCKSIYGIRHKCLDCPDWDYCSVCAATASTSHPSHRFVLIYESKDILYQSRNNRTRHHGIYCDGPLCTNSTSFISGDRYKCAVCPDTDFCANCEASPSNVHNNTHPLIKFKSPVRDVQVTTFGVDHQGQDMSLMGDEQISNGTDSVEVLSRSKIVSTQIQTVYSLTPSETTHTEGLNLDMFPHAKPEEFEPAHAGDAKLDMTPHVESEGTEDADPRNPMLNMNIPAEPETKISSTEEFHKTSTNQELIASFVRDEVLDGTILTPNTNFEQTWYLRNDGDTAWPAKCYAKHVSGCDLSLARLVQLGNFDHIPSMGDPHCYDEVMPGSTASFSVSMRTPSQSGNFVSYWRLTTPSGVEFGPRLWCDIRVVIPEPWVDDVVWPTLEVDDSQMIFPTLEKEAHDSDTQPDSTILVESEEDELDGFVAESLNNEDVTEFTTDDEYEILDASDEACGE